MRVTKIIATVVLLLSIVWMTSAYANDAQKIIADVQTAHASLKDYRAHFSQNVKSFGKTQEASGTLFIKMPGKMRWDYDKPSQKHLITDGAKLWMHLVAEKQVYVQPLGGSANAYLPLQMLTGKMDFSKDYNATDLGDMDNRHNLRFIPKKQGVGFKSVTIGISKASKRIVRFELLDLYGSHTVVTLSDSKINTGLKDSMFRYQETPGVELIKAPGAK